MSRYIISGGGTGGHIFPAISIADKLKEREPGCEILFVGASGRMEMEKVPAAGYKIIGIPISGLKRSLSLDNLKLPFKILKAVRMAKKIIRDFRPDVVIGVGGYASAPTLWAAQRLHIPTVIQEQNSYAGLTNKIVCKKAKSICVAYDGMEKFFPADRIVFTGNPTRKNIRKYSSEDREKGRQLFHLDGSKKTLFIVGGSLGSGTLNKSMRKWISEKHGEDFQIIWQCGKYYEPECRKFIEEHQPENIRLQAFISDMDAAYAAADLVISRAGACSISELQIVGKPTIFVPSPNVTEDHQTHNAMSLVRKDAAMIVKDAEAPEKLLELAAKTIADDSRLNTLTQNILKLAKTDATDRIADEIVKLKKA